MSDDTSARLEPWQWDEATWRGHVNRVRAGRRPPRRGPTEGGCGRAVVRLRPRDHPAARGRDSAGKARPGGVRLPGRRAEDPAALERRSVPATFFMPAVSALLHPEEVAATPMRATRLPHTGGSTSAT